MPLTGPGFTVEGVVCSLYCSVVCPYVNFIGRAAWPLLECCLKWKDWR